MVIKDIMVMFGRRISLIIQIYGWTKCSSRLWCST